MGAASTTTVAVDGAERTGLGTPGTVPVAALTTFRAFASACVITCIVLPYTWSTPAAPGL